MSNPIKNAVLKIGSIILLVGAIITFLIIYL